jgi:hypothetical protein
VSSRPSKGEGAGKTRCAARTHSPVCKDEKHTSVVTTGRPWTGLPCAMVLTMSSVLSSVTGLSCHRRLRGCPPADLTPGSGRQDHTASSSAVARLVYARKPRPPHSRPTFVTTAKRPSIRAGTAELSHDIPKNGRKIFLREGLDRANAFDGAQENRFWAQADSGVKRAVLCD